MMKTYKRLAAFAIVTLPLGHVPSAWAGDDAKGASPDSISVAAETQEFSRDFGSLRSVRIEYKDVIDSTTVLFTPVIGTRRSPANTETSIGGGLELYQKWGGNLSTRTAIFVSEDKQVFAKIDLAQDVTVGLGPQWTGTAGVRWAEYANGDKVLFLSAGARHYFNRGSIAYRGTYVHPNGSDGYIAHLANLTLNDARGRGRTQLWLSYGGTAIDRGLLDGQFRGSDYGGTLRRVQPLGNGRVDAVFVLGLTSYDNPFGRVWGKTAGIGLSLNLGD